MSDERESIKVLLEAVELQRRKSADYQSERSTVKQADYYPNGIATLHDILHAKMLRAKSLIESGNTPKNEALEDTFIDLINYASFCVAYLRGKIPGQDPSRNHLNKPRVEPHPMPEWNEEADETKASEWHEKPNKWGLTPPILAQETPEPEGDFGGPFARYLSGVRPGTRVRSEAAHKQASDELKTLRETVLRTCRECGRLNCDGEGVGHYRG